MLVEHSLEPAVITVFLANRFRRYLLPVLPGIRTDAGHPKPAAEPGEGVLIDQVKPFGGSCSFAKCATASLKRILFPARHPVFPA